MMRRKSLMLLALGGLLSVCGCLGSEPLDEGIDDLWRLQPDLWEQAKPAKLSLGDREMPSRWVIRRDDSLVRSTISLVRATDLLRSGAGAEKVEILVTPKLAADSADVLADARSAMLRLKEVVDPEDGVTPTAWSEGVAEALVSVEHVVRFADTDRQTAQGEDADTGWSAQPVLEMIFGFADEQTGGALLADLEGDDVKRLRQVFTQVIIRLAFAAAGKDDPPELRNEVVRMMDQAPDPEALQGKLASKLRGALAEAPPAGPDSSLPNIIDTVLSAAPKALAVMESFMRQWDKMDRVEVELRRAEQGRIVAVTMAVRPGRRLRFPKLVFMQPEFSFVGDTRIVVYDDVPVTGETAVVFEPAGEGRAEVRFPGLGYVLVRLLALPIQDAALREVRVHTASSTGRRVTNVKVFMEAINESKDPRRMIVYNDAAEYRTERAPFEIRKVAVRRSRAFSYVTPLNRYTYESVKTAADEAGKSSH